MRKIVGFKISLRAFETLRRAKKSAHPLPSDSLGEIQSALDQVVKTLKPAILFETFGREDLDQKLLSPVSGLAYSLILATLGEASGEPWPDTLIGQEALIVEMALDECRKFALGLIMDEARKDSCELSPSSPLLDPQALQIAVKKLEGNKIGVSFSEGRLRPAASSALTLSWISRVKRKKPAKNSTREPGDERLKDAGPAVGGPAENAA